MLVLDFKKIIEWKSTCCISFMYFSNLNDRNFYIRNINNFETDDI